jgi:hypothetical protein
MTLQIQSQGYTQKNWKQMSNMNIQSRIIRNSQKMETV